MKISVKSQYALEALLDLQLHAGSGWENIGNIAQRRGLSEHYLEQILAALRDAGIMESIRGAQGGYRLAKQPEAITAGDIIRALEGPIRVVQCVHSGNAGVDRCPMFGRCVTRTLWERLTDEINDIIDSVTLADLLAHYQGISGEGSPEYSI